MPRHSPSQPRYKRGGPDREQNRLRRSLAEWRLALRIARRSVWRSRGTSLIVVIMVLLPVAGFSAAAVIGQSTFPTPQEKIAAELGQNEAKLYTDIGTHSGMVQDPVEPRYYHSPDDGPVSGGPGDRLDEAGVQALFPGARLTTLTTASVTAETESGVGQLLVALGPLWGDDFAGRTHIVRGAAPAQPGDVLVSEATLARLGARVGDTITLTDPAESLHITGVLDDAMSTDEEEWIYAPATTFGTALETWETSYYLPDTVITRDQLDGLNDAGVTVLSRNVLEHASAGELAMSGGFWSQFGVMLLLAAAFAIFEIVLLAGAAFAVGARKQQRALATLASVGGERRMLYRVVTSQGLVLGLIGGVIGLALGVPAAAVFMRATNNGSATQYWGFHAEPVTLGAVLLVATLVGLCSAIAPARAAVKFDVLAALRGSRKPAQVSAKATRWGLSYLVIGVAATLVGALGLRALNWAGASMSGWGFWLSLAGVIGGPIVLQVGVIMCGGAVLRVIARVVSRVGLGARLASRDSAANRARSVPAFAAIMVTAFLAVVVINVTVSTSTSNAAYHWYQAQPGQAVTYIPTAAPDEDPTDLAALTTLVRDELAPAATARYDEPKVVWDLDTGEPLSGLSVVPVYPPANMCPTDPGSADYDASLADSLSSAEYNTYARKLADTDPRCDMPLMNRAGNVNTVIISDADGLALFLGHAPSKATRDAFAQGAAVTTNPVFLLNQEVTLDWWAPDAERWNPDAGATPERSRAIPAVYAEPTVLASDPVIISAATARTLGIETQPRALVAAPGHEPFTQSQVDALNERLTALGTNVQVENGPQPTWLYIILAVLLIAGALFVGASAVAIGLSRADGRADDATLAAVGATRSLRRAFAFWQAVVLVGVGTVTGTIAGLITTYGISLIDTSGYVAFDPPWIALGALVIGMPLAIAIGSWLVASKPTTLARRVAIG
ncbi:MacB-like core domain-containing protein [Paramicrobacterium humi]|uniref:MacB-like core domain-containing protein n=1 Tax=Paramicrobacterium humi TaxID=640635 RepID=A0A1H4JZ39_9MICO|nr:FtsX-like permease family protein [Microbacterium humi]SEB51443.1 MacB-like core domain-containing protein [Microbacterium humi]